jgi:hypothetical protein
MKKSVEKGNQAIARKVKKEGLSAKIEESPVLSGTTIRSSNLLLPRKRLLGLIFWRLQPDHQRESPGIWADSPRIEVFLRPAKQGRRGGRCSGGLPPRLLLHHSFSRRNGFCIDGPTFAFQLTVTLTNRESAHKTQ